MALGTELATRDPAEARERRLQTAMVPGTVEPLVEQVLLEPLIDPVLAAKQIAQLQAICNAVMTEGHDYGVIPGTDGKKHLLDPGADKLMWIYGLAPRYELLEKVEQWPTPEDPIGFFFYSWRVDFYTKQTNVYVGCGFGSCHSMEKKYRWRETRRQCPSCGKAEAFFRSKSGPDPKGWFCWGKRGGCGAQFEAADERVISQVLGRELNDDVVSLQHTLNRMAQKRARVRGVLSVTRSSGLYEPPQDEPAEAPERDDRETVVVQATAPKPEPDGPYLTEADLTEVNKALARGKRTGAEVVAWWKDRGITQREKIPVALKDELIAWAERRADSHGTNP
jgi:hypothetical protein